MSVAHNTNSNHTAPQPSSVSIAHPSQEYPIPSQTPANRPLPTTNGCNTHTNSAHTTSVRTTQTTEGTTPPSPDPTTWHFPTTNGTLTPTRPAVGNQDEDGEGPLINLDEAYLPLAGSNDLGSGAGGLSNDIGGTGNGAGSGGENFVEGWDGAWRREEEGDVVRLVFRRE